MRGRFIKCLGNPVFIDPSVCLGIAPRYQTLTSRIAEALVHG